jgi:hypothetical protein
MTTSEIPLAFLDRFLDGQRSAQRLPAVDRLVSQTMARQVTGTIENLVGDAIDRFERATGRKRKRSSHPALLFGAGFATGVAAVTVVVWRSRLWRRVSAQLREDVALHEERVADLDDTELAHKVQSIVFRDPSLPKGQVSINAENGKVFLRGQVDAPETIVRIERAVRDVEGVETVDNLLHVPGTPAPHPQGGALIETDGN